MNGYVLDTSVAAKWFLEPEPYTQQAKSLYRAHRAGRVSFLALDFFWFEIANVLWMAVRRRRISPNDAEASLADLTASVSVPTVSSVILRDDALAIALQHNCSVYDAAYLALAVITSRPLITAEERLVRAVGARFPVQWLGAVSS